MLMHAAMMLQAMANPGAPSSRTMNIRMLKTASGARNSVNHTRYSRAGTISSPGVPSSMSSGSWQWISRALSRAISNAGSASDCVMLISATRRLPCARLIDATTEPPMPNISPSPVPSVKSGATILTEARASLPMPRPTKMPSVMTNTAEKTMPMTVGKRKRRKSFPTSELLKSILSRCIFLTFFEVVQK